MMKIFIFILLLLTSITTSAQTNTACVDPLPSWQDGATKQNIIKFVTNVTDKKSSGYVAPLDRIATFDNDGTLWLEQPLYTPAIYSIDRIKQLASQHPEWKTEQPFASILQNRPRALEQMTLKDYEKELAAIQSGSLDDFHKNVANWLNTKINPRFHRRYNQLIYQPMLEFINYLEANDFKVYIVTGGGQEFTRVLSNQVYDIPPEQIIGSAAETQYVVKNGVPSLTDVPRMLFISDRDGKPEAINLFIGKKPLLAVGNSDGDRQMLEWTQSNPKPHFMALVHHDDAAREYAYGPKSKIGTFSDSLMQQAQKSRWNIISIKNDWKNVFPE